jgi:hypothetical protein
MVRSASLLRNSIVERPAGIVCDGWLSFSHSNRVPVQNDLEIAIKSNGCVYRIASNGSLFMPFKQA